MRVKTSITLPEVLLGRLDRVDRNRSALLEREARDRRDREILDRNADALNSEALDTLAYQKLP